MLMIRGGFQMFSWFFFEEVGTRMCDRSIV